MTEPAQHGYGCMGMAFLIGPEEVKRVLFDARQCEMVLRPHRSAQQAGAQLEPIYLDRRIGEKAFAALTQILGASFVYPCPAETVLEF